PKSAGPAAVGEGGWGEGGCGDGGCGEGGCGDGGCAAGGGSSGCFFCSCAPVLPAATAQARVTNKDQRNATFQTRGMGSPPWLRGLRRHRRHYPRIRANHTISAGWPTVWSAQDLADHLKVHRQP